MLTILTANLLLSTLSPKSHPIESRLVALAEQLVDTSILCGQETDTITQAIVNQRFPGYKMLNEASDPNAIWYNPEVLSVCAYQSIPLPNHLTIEQCKKRIPRSLQIVRFLYRDTPFHLFHTHLSYGEADLVAQQVQIIKEQLALIDHSIDCILVGDLNHEYHSNTLRAFFEEGFIDTYHSIHNAFYQGPSYHAFKANFTRLSKVDWILVRPKKLQVIDAQVLDHIPPPQCGSDHYFVEATLQFNNGETNNKQ